MSKFASQDALAKANALWAHIFLEASPLWALVAVYRIPMGEILGLQMKELTPVKAERLYRLVSELMYEDELTLLLDEIATDDDLPF